MSKPILAIITDSVRYDNHHPLDNFTKFDVKHLYNNAPYGDLKPSDLKNAIKWDSQRDLENKLIELNPDIIQGAEPYASRRALRICLSTMKIARKINKPYIFPMFENRPVKDRFGAFTGVIVKKILKKYAQNASLIYYANDGAKRNLLEVSANSKKMIRSVYGFWGIDSQIFNPSAKFKSENNKFQKKYILFVGRLDEAKGIQYMVEGWNSVKKDFPDVDFVFVGKGVLENIVQGNQIQRVPWMKTEELPPYFANALFTVYPSVTLKRWAEQVGTVNLQSLACGTPVITTKSGAIPEYVPGNVGILVPEKDAKAIANAIKKLITDLKLRKKMGINGRNYILEKFNIKKNIEEVEKQLFLLLTKKDIQ